MKKKLLFLIIFISISLLFCFYLFKNQTTTQAITVDNPQELHVYTTNKNDKTATYISPGTYTLTMYNQVISGVAFEQFLDIYISDVNYKTSNISSENIINSLNEAYSKNPENFYYKELVSKIPPSMTYQELKNRDYMISYQVEFTIKHNQYLYIYPAKEKGYPDYNDFAFINYYILEKNVN